MKLGIIGAGNVGCACALTAVNRGTARDIVLVNRTRKTAAAVATDIRYGLPLSPRASITDGDYADLKGCGVVMITSGVNEKTGGATDRNDKEGRLKLLGKNAEIYRDIVPRIVKAAPDAVLLVVTDLVAREAFQPRQPPVGVLTGLVGGVYLGWLLTREWKKGHA